ncbi:unnamed protein product [Orchesella dallaii]|uniref:Sulfotransferase domain-containing protein n=1 Tax=Orchesella dallaii TaxID=48710 RepID=A0ABP1QZL9_9HEXA
MNVLYEEETFNITGLVSFPGSGNTWTRHLIHLATGVYTGSFYFDLDLYSKGFLGEREPWYSGSTIVQKFHERYNKDFEVSKAVLLIREPFPAILSLANFLEAGHTGSAHILPYHQDWPKFILHSAYNWLSLAKSWIESPTNLLVIHYEHLRLQPVNNLRKICDFLQTSCSYLHHPCFQRRLEGSFRRVNSLPLRTQKDVARKARYPLEIRELVSRGSDHLNHLLKERGHEPLPLNLYQYYSPATEQNV